MAYNKVKNKILRVFLVLTFLFPMISGNLFAAVQPGISLRTALAKQKSSFFRHAFLAVKPDGEKSLKIGETKDTPERHDEFLGAHIWQNRHEINDPALSERAKRMSGDFMNRIAEYDKEGGLYQELLQKGIILEIDPFKLKKISEETGVSVYLDAQSFQRGGSFKANGVSVQVYEAFQKRIEFLRSEWKKAIDPNDETVTEKSFKKKYSEEPFYLVTQSTGNHGATLVAMTGRMIKLFSMLLKDEDFPEIAEAIRMIQPRVFTADTILAVKFENFRIAINEYVTAGGLGNPKEILDSKHPKYPAETSRKFVKTNQPNAVYMSHGDEIIMAGHARSAIEAIRKTGISPDTKVFAVSPVAEGGPIGWGAGVLYEHGENTVLISVQTTDYNAFKREMKKLKENTLQKLQDEGQREKNEAQAFVWESPEGVRIDPFDGIAVDKADLEAILIAAVQLSYAVDFPAEKIFYEIIPALMRDLKMSGADKPVVGGTTALGYAVAYSKTLRDELGIKRGDVVLILETEGNIPEVMTDYLHELAFGPDPESPQVYKSA